MKRLLTSCFGLGFLPVAPGSWGSLPAVAVFVALNLLGSSITVNLLITVGLILLGSVVCITIAPYITAKTGKIDPGEVVADELAGQAVTFLIIGGTVTDYIFITAAAGFLLFRLFDITKPWPIRKLEKLPRGWGILADDLLAGVYAGLLLAVFQRTALAEQVNSLLTTQAGASMNMLSAVLLGSVQGLTEFLPVSSSGHLVLLEKLFQFDPEKPQMLMFDLAVHAGTVVAILIVFCKPLVNLVKNTAAFGQYGPNPIQIYKRNPAVHILVLAVIATITTGIVGLLFKKYFISARASLTVVAWMWILTGTLLIITDRRKKARMSLRKFGIAAAILVGLAQAAAIMPGISRSGATICVAILIGLRRRWAVEFSFLLAVPAIAGAGIVQLLQYEPAADSAILPVSCLLAGITAAAVMGTLALKILIKVAKSANLKFFAVYCYILAGFVLFYYSR